MAVFKLHNFTDFQYLNNLLYPEKYIIQENTANFQTYSRIHLTYSSNFLSKYISFNIILF